MTSNRTDVALILLILLMSLLTMASSCAADPTIILKFGG